MDLSVTCCACAGSEQPTFSLLDPCRQHLKRWLETNLNVNKLSATSGYPTHICIPCMSSVRHWINFQTKCRKSQQVFTTALQSTPQSNHPTQVLIKEEDTSNEMVPRAEPFQFNATLASSGENKNTVSFSVPNETENPPKKSLSSGAAGVLITPAKSGGIIKYKLVKKEGQSLPQNPEQTETIDLKPALLKKSAPNKVLRELKKLHIDMVPNPPLKSRKRKTPSQAKVFPLTIKSEVVEECNTMQ